MLPFLTPGIWEQANGWRYNSSAAPATITTAANTLTLTALACGNKPKDVSVTATVNGTSYPGGTSTVSLAPFSISNPTTFCTPSQAYSINNLTCSGASVSWATSPNNIVTPATATGNQVTFTKSNGGTVTLTATISNACGAATTTISRTINAGAPAITITSTNTGACANGGYQTYQLTVNEPANGTNWYWTVDRLNTPTSDIYIDRPNSSATFVDVKGSGVVRLTYTDLCGNTQIDGVTLFSYCPQGFTVAPNPADGAVTVSSEEPAPGNKKAPNLIYAIKITDGLGTVRKMYQYKTGIRTTKISIADLNAGVYAVLVYDGQKWSSKPLIVKR